jgi:hypothetical protein
MSDTEAEAEVVEAAPEAEAEAVEATPEPEVEEEPCVEVKVEKKRKEHGLLREEQQNVVVQPLLTGKKTIHTYNLFVPAKKSL